MAKAIMNCRVYLAEVDLSGNTNAAALNLKSDIVDGTCYTDTFIDRVGAMVDVITDVNGYFEAVAVTGNPDHKMFDQLSLGDALLTLAIGDGALGNRVYFYKPTIASYKPIEGKVSDIGAFNLHAEGAIPLIRGNVLAAKADRGVTGSSTKITLGTYSATQKLYGGLHVFAVSGTPTLDALIAIADRLSVVTVNTAGSGYAEHDVLTVVQTGGSLGTLHVDTVDGGGGVTAVTIVTPGSGYTVANGLSTTVAPPGGTGCKINITAITDTTVLTFTQKTAVGQQLTSDDGPITDVNFKAKWTIGGGAPSLTFAIVAGIV
jgi:hypothetical protein